MDIDRHAEDLASDLGVDKTEVKNDLQNLLEYSVPLDEAKQSVRRKHGDGGGGDATPQTVTIDEITPEMDSVTVTARVLTVGTRTIRYQGDDITIREGELADETGQISYTAWQEFGVEPGDTVTVGNAGIREWEGKPELNMNESSTVALESDPIDVPYDIGGERNLIELEPGDRGRVLEVAVLEVERRTIDGRDGETEILSGVLGDGTGRLPFTDWDPHPEVEPGAELRLSDVYVREFRGVPSVNLSEFTTVEPITGVEVSETAPRMSAREAVDSGGVYDVEIVGNILGVRDGSGLIERCPECGRVVQNGQCRSHGDVEAEDDLRVKAILDDGTATVTVVLDRELTEEVYGATLEEALANARDAMSREVVADEISDRIVGREFEVRGHLSVDDYGANLDAETFSPATDDPTERARSVLAEVRS